MTFSQTFTEFVDEISNNEKTKDPQIRIKNPLDKDVFVNQIQVIPTDLQFSDYGIVEVLINDVSIFSNRQDSDFFASFELYDLPISENRLGRNQDIKIFVWDNEVTGRAKSAVFIIHLSEKDNPVRTGSIPKQRNTISSIEFLRNSNLNNFNSLISEIEALDINNDGVISAIEIQQAKTDAVKTAVDAIDLDNNGIIDAVELAKAETTLVKTAVESNNPVYWSEVTAEERVTTGDGGGSKEKTIYTCPTGKIAVVKKLETRISVSGSAGKMHLLLRDEQIAKWLYKSTNPYALNHEASANRQIWSEGSYPQFNKTFSDLEGQVLEAGDTIKYDGDFSGDFNATLDYAYSINERDV